MTRKTCNLAKKIILGLMIAGFIISVGFVVLAIVKDHRKILYAIAVLGFMAVACLGVLEYFVLKLLKMDDYERNVYLIFKLNSGILVNGDSVSNGEVITVKSFKDLLKVQSSMSLPILYIKSETKCIFSIKCGNLEYRYTLKK